MDNSAAITTRNIGLIGLGYMGHGIARNVLKVGFSLRVLDHPGGHQATDDVVALDGVAEVDAKALGR
jgi:3-hydroxyisobutyrate dehydrogenase